jgi:glycyl-tRNA synthetase beta chain
MLSLMFLSIVVMAGLVPAIHVLLPSREGVDARDKRGHDEVL